MIIKVFVSTYNMNYHCNDMNYFDKYKIKLVEILTLGFKYGISLTS